MLRLKEEYRSKSCNQTWHRYEPIRTDKISVSGNIWAYTSDGVAESSGGAGQGAKSSTSVDILALAQLCLVHN